MKAIPDSHHAVLRWSLVATWLVTAVVSLIEWHGQSLALLQRSRLIDDAWAPWLIGGGVGVDVVLGLALALVPGRWTCLAALASMASMTVAATVLLPTLWLDPLGPLLKNLPIAAALWTLMRETA